MIFVRSLRFVFHLLYHQFAWTYDAVAALVSAGLWQSWVQSAVQYLDGAERILEVGHGPGHLQRELGRLGRPAVGVDFSRQMTRLARHRLERAGYPPTIVRADGRALPFPDAHFDALVATFPAEYIAEPAAWASFKRVLAPQGRIVVLLGAFPGGRHPLRLLSRSLLRLTGAKSGAEISSALQMRTRQFDFFEQIGLVGEFMVGQVKNSETFFILASHKK